jgi:hypothetical protein
MRYQTRERGSVILQRQPTVAALTTSGAFAFVLVATWVRDGYAAPSA